MGAGMLCVRGFMSGNNETVPHSSSCDWTKTEKEGCRWVFVCICGCTVFMCVLCLLMGVCQEASRERDMMEKQKKIERREDERYVPVACVLHGRSEPEVPSTSSSATGNIRTRSSFFFFFLLHDGKKFRTLIPFFFVRPKTRKKGDGRDELLPVLLLLLAGPSQAKSTVWPRSWRRQRRATRVVVRDCSTSKGAGRCCCDGEQKAVAAAMVAGGVNGGGSVMYDENRNNSDYGVRWWFPTSMLERERRS